jgi:hypothetical protein
VYRKSQKLERQAVQNADIVVTTYHQLLMSCPWPTKEWFAKLARSRAQGGGSIDEETDIEEWICENRKDLGGVLHQISWYRVSSSSSFNTDHVLTNHLQIVLDEAVSDLGEFPFRTLILLAQHQEPLIPHKPCCECSSGTI